MNYKPNEGDGRSIVSSSESSDRDDQLIEIIQQQRREITDLRATVEKLVKTVEAQSEQISTLEDVHTDYRETNERDKAEIRQDVTENKRATEQNKAHTEAVARKLERCDGSEERTPLEQIVRLPDEILHRAQLTANQRRARTIAMELGGLATTVPKGKRLDSTTIKEQLQHEYGSTHDQTVARVMAFLDRLGGNRTEVVHTGKGKAVIFDDWLANRLQRAEQFTMEAVDGVLTNVVSVTTRTAG
ncbi:hypothetical protein [Halocatena halophila]|uniref:hypothetical protein n=1 Tax=Halocatena halophila TaxID=2814576 RepID=UPI002ED5991B